MIAVQRPSNKLERFGRRAAISLKEALKLAFPKLSQWPLFKPEVGPTIGAVFVGFLSGVPVGRALSHEPWPIGVIVCLGVFAAGIGAFQHFCKARKSWPWVVDLGIGLILFGLSTILAWLATN